MGAHFSVEKMDFSESKNYSDLTEALKSLMNFSATSNPFGFTDLVAITASADPEQITGIN